MDASRNLTPQQIGSYWAVPQIDGTANSQVQVQLSVSVSDDESLTGGDVTVKAMANDSELSATSSPDAGSPLPTVQTRAMTAFALYTFDNPQNSSVTSIVVTIKDASATFDLSFPVA